jgi:hypothetical protein
VQLSVELLEQHCGGSSCGTTNPSMDDNGFEFTVETNVQVLITWFFIAAAQAETEAEFKRLVRNMKAKIKRFENRRELTERSE